MFGLLKRLFFVLFVFGNLVLFAQVGIGTPTPTEELDVVGNIKFSGEIKPNGVSGDSGKVLTSQGAGNPSVWLTATNSLFNNSYTDYGTAQITVTNNGFTLIPGLSHTLTLTGPAKVMIVSDGGIATSSTANNGYSIVDIVLTQDGSILNDGGYKTLLALNGRDNDYAIENWSFGIIIDVPAAGTYTWDLYASLRDGDDAIVSSDNSEIYQGTMNIVVIYE